MSTWAPANNVTWIENPDNNASQTIRIDKFKELHKNINNIRYTLGYNQITSSPKNYKGYINFCNTNYPNISIQFDECIGLDEIEYKIHSFQNLLSLASYGTSSLLWAVLHFRDVEGEDKSVNLYKKGRSIPNKDAEAIFNNFLFNCQDIRFDVLVENLRAEVAPPHTILSTHPDALLKKSEKAATALPVTFPLKMDS